jgi:hypothetical protein
MTPKKHSEFKIEEYTPDRLHDWESFLENSANGTIFHSQKFLDYHPPGRFNNHHLFLSMRNKTRAIFTGAVIDNGDGPELHSYPGASYGGFVIRKDADFQDYFGMVEALTEYCGDKGFKKIRLTQTPIIYHPQHQQGIEFALQVQGYEPEIIELTQSVNLKMIGEDVYSSLVDKTRNACRQAEKKGIIYRENEPLNSKNIADFYDILFKNRNELGVHPTHTDEELNLLSKLIGDNLHLAFVETEGKRVAGLLHFICNSRVLLLFYVCHYREYQHLKPVPYLLAKTIEWAESQGFEELDFGISTVKGEPTTGLLKFKENFRARPFLRTTYVKELE